LNKSIPYKIHETISVVKKQNYNPQIEELYGKPIKMAKWLNMLQELIEKLVKLSLNNLT
jgi:hypothetical protein